MHSLSCWLFALLSFAYVLASPTRTAPRGSPHSSFVTSSSGGLFVNGSPFRFIGTNAYWLPGLNSDDDISKAFADMAADGITVVRVWAFNDVAEIPAEGIWFQLIANGTTVVNTGPNGLQRLDKVLEIAAQHNIYVILSLTNNWNPIAQKSSASGSPPPLPRNSLSSDYGGMDAYVREFTKDKTHDLFYTDQTIRNFFENYLKAVITRYADSTTLVGWELANDPRCGSSLAASPSCNTQTITLWHSQIADFIQTIDSNHLLTSGNQGFFCPNCPKLFPLPQAPAPAPSPAPGGGRRRSIRRSMSPSTLFQMITKERRSESRASTPRDGVKIRGRWSATSQAKRGGGGVGSAFDGSQGVDSEDILNIPNIGFASFQLFPDQNVYSTIATGFTPPSANFDGIVQQGIAWIEAQAASAQTVGKPIILAAFGLVSQGNLKSFIPFNATTPAATSSTARKRQSPGTVGTGVTNTQLSSAYSAWFQAGLNSGVSGMLQYQFSDQNLTPAPGTVVQGSNGQGSVGTTPNDGYGNIGSGPGSVQQTLLTASQNFT